MGLSSLMLLRLSLLFRDVVLWRGFASFLRASCDPCYDVLIVMRLTMLWRRYYGVCRGLLLVKFLEEFSWEFSREVSRDFFSQGC